MEKKLIGVVLAGLALVATVPGKVWIEEIIVRDEDAKEMNRWSFK